MTGLIPCHISLPVRSWWDTLCRPSGAQPDFANAFPPFLRSATFFRPFGAGKWEDGCASFTRIDRRNISEHQIGDGTKQRSTTTGQDSCMLDGIKPRQGRKNVAHHGSGGYVLPCEIEPREGRHSATKSKHSPHTARALSLVLSGLHLTSPKGAKERSPPRERWENIRNARSSPGGATLGYQIEAFSTHSSSS